MIRVNRVSVYALASSYMWIGLGESMCIRSDLILGMSCKRSKERLDIMIRVNRVSVYALASSNIWIGLDKSSVITILLGT